MTMKMKTTMMRTRDLMTNDLQRWASQCKATDPPSPQELQLVRSRCLLPCPEQLRTDW